MTPALPYQPEPAALEHVCGVCRVCGCTDWEGCLLEVDHDEGYIVTCSWAECDLCSRCWGPHRPTARQLGELARIRDRHGPLRISRGRRGVCELEVALVGNADLGPHWVVRPALLTLDAKGRVVNHLAREVKPTSTEALAATVKREVVPMHHHTDNGVVDLVGTVLRRPGSPPEQSLAQRLTALNKANRIRSHRAELKRELKTHDIRPEQLLDDPECDTMKLLDLLVAIPKVGRVKANSILRKIEASPSKTLGGLSDRQRCELVDTLRVRP